MPTKFTRVFVAVMLACQVIGDEWRTRHQFKSVDNRE
jgi:hypothetical protein